MLVLLPSSGSPFCARFTGPYTVLRKMTDQNYQIATPDRRKAKQCFHVNLLKPYSCNSEIQPVSPVVTVSSASLDDDQPFSVEGGGDVIVPEDCVLLPRLKNSETLKNLDALFLHLSDVQRSELTKLVLDFPSLFADVPTRTHLIQHDVDVGDARPIR